MKITKKWLEINEACKEGKAWFFNQNEDEGIKVVKILIKNNNLEWANWLIARILNKKQKIGYAVYAAEQVISVFEDKYPGERPRKAIESAKSYLRNPSKKTKAAADADAEAAYSAYAAAYSAYAAADTAYAAADADAYTAAAAAAYAATYAAYAAADADADAAADASARKNMKVKILKYGIKLLGN